MSSSYMALVYLLLDRGKLSFASLGYAANHLKACSAILRQSAVICKFLVLLRNLADVTGDAHKQSSSVDDEQTQSRSISCTQHHDLQTPENSCPWF